jgi:murein DD-endopeptidase MepM/ murein hydrolase activator NlpD
VCVEYKSFLLPLVLLVNILPVCVADFPLILQLDQQKDIQFKQYSADVEKARARVLAQKPINPQSEAEKLVIYEYKGSETDLLKIAARCQLDPSTLASLNRIRHRQETGTLTLLLPTIPGLFVPYPSSELEREKLSELEKLMLNARIEKSDGVILTVRGEQFLFFPGAKFNTVENIFFLKEKDGFRYPLSSWTLTSGFGIRKNPVTGLVRKHNGLDLAAPMGTPVFAAQAGTVSETGADAIYGNYVVIKHSDNWVSLYGHLSKIKTKKNSEVYAGTLIGEVGSTGQSTGPHLHFELRKNGQAQDPGKLLFKEQN